MPVGIKDVFDTIDMPTEMGTPVHAGRWPDADAAHVYALRSGGGIVVGKTVTSQFAIVGNGPTRNPPRSVAFARRDVGRFCRRCRRADAATRNRLAGAGLDPATSKLLRHHRLQADVRRAQPRRLSDAWRNHTIISARWCARSTICGISCGTSDKRRAAIPAIPDCLASRRPHRCENFRVLLSCKPPAGLDAADTAKAAFEGFIDKLMG